MEESGQVEFGRRLRRLRIARGLAQRDLAEGAVTSSYISLLESGRRAPTTQVLDHLAGVLGVAVHELTDPGRRLIEFADGPDAGLGPTDEVLLGQLDIGGLHAAASTLARAYAAARGADEPRAAEIGVWLTRVWTVLDQHQQRFDLISDLIAPGECEFGPNLRAYLDAELADACHALGRLADARDVALAARGRLRAAAAATEPLRAIRVLAQLVRVLADLGEIRSAQEALAELRGYIPEAKPDGRAHWLAALACRRAELPAQARHHLTEATDSLAVPLLPLAEWVELCRFAADLYLEPDPEVPGAGLEEALNWLNAAEAGTRALGSALARSRIRLLRTRYELAAGQPERALEQLPEFPTAELTAFESAEALLLQGQVLIAVGQAALAEVELRAVIEHAESLGAYRVAMRAWRALDEARGGPGSAR